MDTDFSYFSRRKSCDRCTLDTRNSPTRKRHNPCDLKWRQPCRIPDCRLQHVHAFSDPVLPKASIIETCLRFDDRSIHRSVSGSLSIFSLSSSKLRDLPSRRGHFNSTIVSRDAGISKIFNFIFKLLFQVALEII